MFRRRRLYTTGAVADLDAARVARNANGAYDAKAEWEIAERQHLADINERRLRHYFASQNDGFTISHSPASSAVGEHSPEPSTIPRRVESSGLSNLDDKRRQERQQVWARRDAQTIARACSEIDELRANLAFADEVIDRLQAMNRELHAENVRCGGVMTKQECEIQRLRSELNQAIAQRDIARRQRDQFCAQLVHEDNEKQP